MQAVHLAHARLKHEHRPYDALNAITLHLLIAARLRSILSVLAPSSNTVKDDSEASHPVYPPLHESVHPVRSSVTGHLV